MVLSGLLRLRLPNALLILSKKWQDGMRCDHQWRWCISGCLYRAERRLEGCDHGHQSRSIWTIDMSDENHRELQFRMPGARGFEIITE